MQDRRQFLQHTAAGLGAFVLSPAALAAGLKPLGRPQAFDYALLKGQARALAAAPFQDAKTKVPESIDKLSWDAYQSIRFKQDHALWGDAKLRFQVKFFHLGLFFKSPVRMHEVVDGHAQELAYDPAMFDYGTSGVNGRRLPRDLGFAGFRVNLQSDRERDVSAFLGASYFRAVDSQFQYGLSARGLAVNTGFGDRAEEFPNFVGYWLERPAADSNTLVVYALLDSPSVAGAYRFAITPAQNGSEPQLMDVDAALYPRKAIERIGIAPGTSMFQHGENDRRLGYDWRPEIHDSDGLALWTGAGEWIWRPLTNPRSLRFNAFQDNNPRGFGLLQRDREFDHYQDDGVFYDRRPSLWIEPKAGWGEGSVQLVEIPTADETFDNIVAFWNPAAKPQPGQELLFGYRLYWGAQPPSQPHLQSQLARCVATRTGLGGVVGQKRSYFSWRFAVDFAGDELAKLDNSKTKVASVITASRGKVELASVRPIGGGARSATGWRAMFDLRPDDSLEPITLRLFLQTDGKPLTETWLYQWEPPPLNERQVY